MKGEHLFTNKELLLLLIPVIAEQFLNSLMGMADNIMVSNVGSAAISAVSLVDSINNLIIQVFQALATGGVIICATYIGQKRKDLAKDAAGQLLFVTLWISVIITAIGLFFRTPLLHKIFGEVEESVMDASSIYFVITILSYPFVALAAAGSAIFRAQSKTSLPMILVIISNGINIVGNAILIFGFDMGVEGAALSTLFSRVLNTLLLLYFLRDTKLEIPVRRLFRVRPDIKKIKRILSMGIPNGVENGMFQFGKLAIQSSVSTLATYEIAAQAMTNIFENVNGVAGIGIGIGLMTVVGRCMGAGREDEARYYVKKLTGWAFIAITVSCLIVYLISRPVTMIAGMEPAAAELCVYMVGWITIVKPIFWSISFVPAYGYRAAGDVAFSMIVSTATMWLCRVSLCTILIRYFGVHTMAVWIGMFSDWALRSLIYGLRFRSGRWLKHKVV